MSMHGLVTKNTGSWYQVKTEEGQFIDCKIKGNLRLRDIKSTNPIAVGDNVEFILGSDGIGFISDIHDRKNFLVRRSSNLSKKTHILASNLDLVGLIVTLRFPETSTTFIDRFLATAEAYSIPGCIVINKIDLFDEKDLAYAHALKQLYESLDYPVFLISAFDKNSVNELVDFLKNKTTLISGNSGVGKSTLINTILPEQAIRTAVISSYHNKGMHTTTFSEMFQLEGGGYLIDTPGIKGFGTVDMDQNEVGHFFKEIFYHSKNCRFANCTHLQEPGCAVQQAVKDHLISQSRYESFLSILTDSDAGKYR